MRYPVDNFDTDWNVTAGLGFGDKTPYGYHDGVDLNKSGGGDIDLGEALYAIADGIISSVHHHSTYPTFGDHIHLKFQIGEKDYWAHYAHCRDILVNQDQEVKEGQKIATVGKSGLDPNNPQAKAHSHFAIKNQPTGVDGIAKTLDDLKKWENPIVFIKKNLNESLPLQTELDKVRLERDKNWNLYQEALSDIEGLKAQIVTHENFLKQVATTLGTAAEPAEIMGDVTKLVNIEDQLRNCQKERDEAVKKRDELTQEIDKIKKTTNDAIEGEKRARKDLDIQNEVLKTLEKENEDLKKKVTVIEEKTKPKNFLEWLLRIFR